MGFVLLFQIPGPIGGLDSWYRGALCFVCPILFTGGDLRDLISIRVYPKIVCHEIIEDRIIGLFRCVVLTQENVCGKGNMLREVSSLLDQCQGVFWA